MNGNKGFFPHNKDWSSGIMDHFHRNKDLMSDNKAFFPRCKGLLHAYRATGTRRAATGNCSRHAPLPLTGTT